MTRTRIALALAGSLFLGAAGLRAETNAPPAAETPAVSRSLYVSIPGVFGELKRPPVRFDHDKHTKALEPKGCEECHPKNAEGKFTFGFPKEREGKNATALMNAFHDTCVGCHKTRAKNKEKGGPVICGECHVVEKEATKKQYGPVLPEFYDPRRDIYHRECLACHRDPAKTAEHAGELDWMSFHIQQKKKTEAEWPAMSFDHLVHDKHDKVFPKKCDLCHYIAPERLAKIKAEGKEPACKDWLYEIDEKTDLRKREVAHERCLNCHLERRQKKEEKAGPVTCGQCHTGKERSLEELAEAPRMKCDQHEKILIDIKEGARAKAVPFDHKAHETRTRSCQECHHQTVRACKDCHPIEGNEEGKHITLAEAYHEVTSKWSCVGCHESQKRKPDCAGCHSTLKTALAPSICDSCHTGTLQSLADAEKKLPPPEELIAKDTKEKIEIAVLKKEYELSTMPHLAISKKLTEIANSTTLARYFHKDELAVCVGCHHGGPLEKKKNPPTCRTCHTARAEPEQAKPTLLGAYHQDCMGCHKEMGGTEEKMPQKCTGCHKEAKKQ